MTLDRDNATVTLGPVERRAVVIIAGLITAGLAGVCVFLWDTNRELGQLGEQIGAVREVIRIQERRIERLEDRP